LVFVSFTLEGANNISKALGARGNVTSDGRPILGLSARDLTEICLTADPEARVIPAHVWTPWFSLFGSMSGFNTVEECFKDLTPQIKCLETGLSSDPFMNRLLSSLDPYLLVSSSDAHSPDKLGREATILEGSFNAKTLKEALTIGKGLHGTVEFFPEEGKYHLDGHAGCGPALLPEETRKYKGICPVCGKPLTVGVLSRVMELADRLTPPPSLMKPDFHIFPLTELLGQVMGQGPNTKGVTEAYQKLLKLFPSEYNILMEAPLEKIEKEAGSLLRLGIERTRKGEVITRGGYDGIFGVVEAISEEDRREDKGLGSLFESTVNMKGRRGRPKRSATPLITLLSNDQKVSPIAKDTMSAKDDIGNIIGNSMENNGNRNSTLETGNGDGINKPGEEVTSFGFLPLQSSNLSDSSLIRQNCVTNNTQNALKVLNPLQRKAVTHKGRSLLVLAGPGSGKTRVLLTRALWLLEEKILAPEELLLTTFTKKAASVLSERLMLMGGSYVKEAKVATLHSLAMEILIKNNVDFSIAKDDFRMELATLLSKDLPFSPKNFLNYISRLKNLRLPLENDNQSVTNAIKDYEFKLSLLKLIDFDDLIKIATSIVLNANPVKYKAILADEAQDLSSLEYHFLSLLSQNSSLTAIGDPAQSIYGFRGALSSLEEEVKKDRHDLTITSLPLNYRSTAIISDVSENFRTMGGPPRKAFSKVKGKRIVRACLDTPWGESIFIAKKIKEHLGELFLGGGSTGTKESLDGLTLGDIAVIFRLRCQGEEILKTLLEEGLPCQISGEDEIDAQDGLDLKAEKISLITMHAAKGLEFRLVFVTGLEEGLFPITIYDKPFESDFLNRANEEERLFYVAITRAKELIYLTRAKKRTVYGHHLSGKASPFWDRIPSEYAKDIRPAYTPTVKFSPLF
jgi:uncharacterized protein (TIGR00375 family)